ncbi:MAG: hypothetical protein GC137_06800 [Alphaproteobacteria bacterium]|nr:hypothetical protein [Alphaproteobacteria bacterium]
MGQKNLEEELPNIFVTMSEIPELGMVYGAAVVYFMFRMAWKYKKRGKSATVGAFYALLITTSIFALILLFVAIFK